MMKLFSRRFDYIAALLRANFRAHHADIRRTLLLGGFMFVQNLMFFMIWVIFFGSISQVKGWRLGDVGLMCGIVATAVGLVMFAADGVRTIALKVQDGSMDGFLIQPRHPLPALLLSRSNAASIGDMISGPVFWFAFAGAPLSQLPVILGLTLLSAVIFLSALVAFYSLAFWLQRSGRFSDQLFEMLVIFSSIPQHAQSMSTKLVMFSILPAGFIGLLPVSLLHHFDGLGFLMLIGAAIVYAVIAVGIFNAGVKRYVRG